MLPHHLKNCLFLFLAFFFQVPAGFASSPDLDSIRVELEQASSMEKRIQILCELGREIVRSDVEEAKKCHDQAKKWADEKDSQKGRLWATGLSGSINYQTGDKEKAIGDFEYVIQNYNSISASDSSLDDWVDHILYSLGETYCDLGKYKKALDIYQQSLQKRILDKAYLKVSNTYEAIGEVYFLQGDYVKSIENHTNSLRLREVFSGPNTIAICYNNIGANYFRLGEVEKALEYFKLAIAEKEKLGNFISLAKGWYNIGAIFYANENLDSAQFYFEKSLDVLRQNISTPLQSDIARDLSRSYDALAVVCRHKEQYNQALGYYAEALEIKEQIGDQFGIAALLSHEAVLYAEMGLLDQAEAKGLESVKVAKEIGAKFELSQAYLTMSDVYKRKRQFRKAFDYLWDYQKIRKDILSLERTQEIAKITASYELEKGKREIAEQNLEIEKKEAMLSQQTLEIARKTVERNVTIVVALLTSLLVGLIWYFRKREQKKAEESTKQTIIHYLNEIELLKANLKIKQIESKETTQPPAKEKELNDILVTPLTKRELMVVKLICEGLTNKQIAEKMFLSVNTIKSHNQRIFEKLDVKNRTQAMVLVSSFDLPSVE